MIILIKLNQLNNFLDKEVAINAWVLNKRKQGKKLCFLTLFDGTSKLQATLKKNNIGEKLTNIVGTNDPNKIEISNVENLKEVIIKTKPDVAVDFTIAPATEKNCLI